MLDEVNRSGEQVIPTGQMISREQPRGHSSASRTSATRPTGCAPSRSDRGVAWSYHLRLSAHGEPAADLDRPESAFRRQLARLERGGFAYFVVRDDSFEAFGKAREIARARGISVGWHPVVGPEPVRLSAVGSLGKRIQ